MLITLKSLIKSKCKYISKLFSSTTAYGSILTYSTSSKNSVPENLHVLHLSQCPRKGEEVTVEMSDNFCKYTPLTFQM